MSTDASSTAAANAHDASIFQRLHPKAYLERFLAAGFRPDGRRTGDWRELSVNVGEPFLPRQRHIDDDNSFRLD